MKILDATLRDGGFVNNFMLDYEIALRIIALLDSAELDAVEIGYLTGLPPDHGSYPDAGICLVWAPERIAEVVSRVATPIVGMLHPSGPAPLDIRALAQSGLALVRIPITPTTDMSWRDLAETLGAEGIRFTINLTLATWSTPEAVTTFARTVEQAGADIFYIADTNSAFLPHHIENIFRRLSDSIRLPLGFHAHDGKRLAHANVLAALNGGASWADGSLGGIGRGPGNAATEILHEIAGKDRIALYRILRALPGVAEAFGVDCTERLWQQLCAFMDFWPPTIEMFDRAERNLGIDKYSLIAERILGRQLDRPPKETEIWEMIALGALDPAGHPAHHLGPSGDSPFTSQDAMAQLDK